MNRREALTVVAAAALTVAANEAAAQAPRAAAAPAAGGGDSRDEKPMWGEPQEATPGGAAAEPNPKRMGDGITLMFHDFRLELRGEAGPMSQSRAWGARLPLSVPDGRSLLGVAHNLRLAVDKSAGAAVLVVGDFGGMPLIIDLPAEGVRGGDAAPLGPGEMSRHAFTFAPAPRGDGAAAPLPPHAVTLLVSARRSSAADEVTVSVDSLDLRAVTEPADSQAPQPQPPAGQQQKDRR
jgi:hypothetical protein